MPEKYTEDNYLTAACLLSNSVFGHQSDIHATNVETYSIILQANDLAYAILGKEVSIEDRLCLAVQLCLEEVF